MSKAVVDGQKPIPEVTKVDPEVTTTPREDGHNTSQMMAKSVPPLSPAGSKTGRIQPQFDFNFTEGQHRRVLMADCETECSQILENLYVAGATVAADLAELQRNGITHVVNCSADVVEDFFIHLPEFNYLSLNMVDGRMDDITWFLGDVIHFVDAAHKNGHIVLIHCERGVSRSCSFAIAYTMWVRGTCGHQSSVICRQSSVIPSYGIIYGIMYEM